MKGDLFRLEVNLILYGGRTISQAWSGGREDVEIAHRLGDQMGRREY